MHSPFRSGHHHQEHFLAIVVASAAAEIMILLGLFASAGSPPRSFTIDRDRKCFLLDGTPFRFVSGSIHYFRVPQPYWGDRLKKTRAGGFNAVQVYVEWKQHEPEEGQFDFEGAKNLEKFLELAHMNDLYVILRPGPFIDGERDMGGLPYWLLRAADNRHPAEDDNNPYWLRTLDPRYMRRVEIWLAVLFKRIRRFTLKNGGPIIMVQVENEYGSYAIQTGNSDIEYLSRLRDLTWQHLGPEVFLFSVDGGFNRQDIMLSRTPGVYSTVDFGPNSNHTEAFINQRFFEPNGPLVNPEFYAAWLDHWAEPHCKTTSQDLASGLDRVLQMGANINIYMVHGGTSFGYSAGSNRGPGGILQPSPTSYDYDAPISEAGDLTEKYFALRNVIKKYLPIPKIEVNATVPKAAYGKVQMLPRYSLKSILESRLALPELTKVTTQAEYPMGFEDLHQDAGLVVYKTEIKDLFKDPAVLDVPGLADRGYVFIEGGGLAGIMSRMTSPASTSMPISIRPNQTLAIVVENQGRVCFGLDIHERKGITRNVTLNGVLLRNWTMHPLPLEKLSEALLVPESEVKAEIEKNMDRDLLVTGGSMSHWQGMLKICGDERPPKDSFLSLTGWTKGVAFVNGINLGRYWPGMGPQQTLYVPGVFLSSNCSQPNKVEVFEQDRADCAVGSRYGNEQNCYVEFVAEPSIDGPVPVA